MPHVETYIDGVWFPSVTTILGDRPKPWLEKWREKWGVLAERKTAAANATGTAFHAGAEALVLGEDVPYPANRRLGKMLERFEQWTVDSGFIVKETELHVVSKTHTYAGTFDATGYLFDKRRVFKELVLCDWKTSSAIYPEMALQLAAYAQAYKEQTGIEIKRGIIVHVSKDKPNHKLTVKEYKLGKRLLNKFLKRLREFNEARA